MDASVWVYGWRVGVCGGVGYACWWVGWMGWIGVRGGVCVVCVVCGESVWGGCVCVFCFCFSKPFTIPQNNVKYLLCFCYLSFSVNL